MRTAWNACVSRRLPFSLVHFVTNRCNGHCPHCFVEIRDPRSEADELTLEEIGELTRHLGGCLFNVNLTGGEPFLRKDLWEIAEAYLRNASVRSVYITSHGGFPESVRQFVERFIASPDSNKCQLTTSFSVDDIGEDHDRRRGIPGLFARALESYAFVRDRQHPRVRANLGITVTPWNHDRVLQLYEHLTHDQKVGSITATAMRRAGKVRSIPAHEMTRIQASYQALTRRILADRQAGRLEGFGGSLRGRLMNAKNREMYALLARNLVDPHFESWCPAASTFGVIAAEGTVYPCEVLERPMGNLREHGMDLCSLWEDGPAGQIRSRIAQSRCHCTYECAWTVNLISNPRRASRLLLTALNLHA